MKTSKNRGTYYSPFTKQKRICTDQEDYMTMDLRMNRIQK